MRKFDDFAFVTPSDVLFPAKTVLQKVKSEDSLVALNDAFNNVLDIANEGSDVSVLAKVESALNDFGSFAEKILNGSKDPMPRKNIFESVKINDFWIKIRLRF